MDVRCADPYILFDKESNTFYCYGTSNISKNKKTFYIYKSKDLINWEFIDYALDLSINNWGKDWYWAPEVYYNEKTKRYFMFYSARMKDEYLKKYFADSNYEEGCKIGVATSLSPCGPFINVSNLPLDYYPFDESIVDIFPKLKNKMDGHIDKLSYKSCKKGYYLSMIDPNVFFDDDGRIYLYFSRCCYRNRTFDSKLNKFIEESNILMVELDDERFNDLNGKIMPKIKENYLKLENNVRKDRFNLIISYHEDPQDWENGHINDFTIYKGKKKDRRRSEGSTTFYKYTNYKKEYFITYSCNNFENELYGVGIAKSNSPFGLFKKDINNPIIHENINENLYSTGHGSILELNGKYCYLFHGRCSLNSERILYCGELEFVDDSFRLKKYTKCNLID